MVEHMDLLYNGKPMKWAPKRVLCLQAHGPLDGDEPDHTDILALVALGYSVFVMLEPGDGTRYGLMIVGNGEQVVVTRVGARSRGAVVARLGFGLPERDCAVFGEGWTPTFLAWWIAGLVAGAR